MGRAPVGRSVALRACALVAAAVAGIAVEAASGARASAEPTAIATPVATASPLELAPPLELAAIVLEDPQGRAWTLAELGGQPVLLVVADRAASREAARWGERLAESRRDRIAVWAEPGKVVVLSIADVRVVPAFARPMARWTIARFVADLKEQTGRSGPPLLLDWDGAIAGPIGARPDVPNLLLVDAVGRPVHRQHAVVDDARLAELVAAIDRVLAPAASAAPAAVPAAAPTPVATAAASPGATP